MEDVLVRQRNAVQWTVRIPARNGDVGSVRSGKCAVWFVREKAVEVRLQTFQAVKASFRHIKRGHLPVANRVGDVDERHAAEILHHEFSVR